jgi:hypothetical protein
MEMAKSSIGSAGLEYMCQIVVFCPPGSQTGSHVSPWSRVRSIMLSSPEGRSPIDRNITPLSSARLVKQRK